MAKTRRVNLRKLPLPVGGQRPIPPHLQGRPAPEPTMAQELRRLVVEGALRALRELARAEPGESDNLIGAGMRFRLALHQRRRMVLHREMP